MPSALAPLYLVLWGAHEENSIPVEGFSEAWSTVLELLNQPQAEHREPRSLFYTQPNTQLRQPRMELQQPAPDLALHLWSGFLH